MDYIYSLRLIPVLTLDKEDHALHVAEALLSAEVPIMEITLRTEGALGCIVRVKERFPEMVVGAGTILNREQVHQAMEAGASFGVAPGINPRVVQEAKEYTWPFIPGVQTASEIEHALELDCRLLKFFPAEPAGGVPMLKALSAPYAHLGARFIPLGGITPQTAPAWLALSSVAAIGGSWLVTPNDLAESAWARIRERAIKARELTMKPIHEPGGQP